MTYQNEFQAAYAVSQELQAQHNFLDIPEGQFAVVMLSLAYCQFTDATLPNPHRTIIKLFGSRRIADHVAKAMNAKLADWEECEVSYEVFPKAPFVRGSLVPNDDDIPF